MFARFLLIIIVVILLAGGIYGYLFYKNNLQVPYNKNAASQSPEANLDQEGNKTGLPFKIPKGASFSVFARDLINPRVMVFDPKGNILVSIPSQGKVVGLNQNGSQTTVFDGLKEPHGLAFFCHNQCQLYIAETNQVSVFDYDSNLMKAMNQKKILDLPGGGVHFTRTITTTDDGKLLVATGSDCNVCNEDDQRRASIWISDSDGSNFKPFAQGLRNSVFMTKNPKTGDIWATEMGRDWLGDNLPPDEINIIKEGKNYGWPYCYGKNVHDTNFDPRNQDNACSGREPSHIDLPAHSAPLGLEFFKDSLLVSYHGSWNRSTPTGYKVVRITGDCIEKSNPNGSCNIEDFVTGWLSEDGHFSGRPAGILVEGQKIYISDDKAGVIYLLTIRG